jgi:group I intron endonuclease
MTGSIYLVTNTVNNKVYVGQTDRTLGKRWNAHCSNARTSVSPTYLYKAINKHGRDAFTISLVETVPLEQLDAAEIKWIAFYESFTDRTKGYNLTAGGGGIRGMVHSFSTKKKMSESHSGAKNYAFGTKKSQEWKDKMSAAMMGVPKTFEARANMSVAQKAKVLSPDNPIFGNKYAVGNKNRLGIKHTPEAIQKISLALTGRVQSAEELAMRKGIAKRGPDNPLFGIPLSEETRTRMSIAKTGTKRSAAECENIRQFHTGRKRSPETIERMRVAALNRKTRVPYTQETRDRMSASMKAALAAKKLLKAA